MVEVEVLKSFRRESAESAFVLSARVPSLVRLTRGKHCRLASLGVDIDGGALPTLPALPACFLAPMADHIENVLLDVPHHRVHPNTSVKVERR